MDALWVSTEVDEGFAWSVRRLQGMSTAEGSRASGREGAPLVSEAERTYFVEAVLAGEFTPTLTAVAYHFSGWLDGDVVQAVFEVSSDATEAVSALAGLSPPAEKSSDDDQERGPSLAPTAPGDTASTTPDDETAATMMGANERLARTLEAIHAQRGSSTPSVGPSATPAGQGDAFTAATTPPPPPPSGTSPAPLKPAAPATEAGSDGDVGPPPAASGGHGDGGNCVSTENVELEKVAAFIANYAGEQEAAAKACCAPTKPPEPLFPVPQGMSAPLTRTAQLVIVNTAEKTVKLPGFEAFMKMQHGKDRLFRFLEVDHDLHSYYLLAKQHARKAVMEGGKAKGARAPAVRVNAAHASSARAKTEDPDVADIMRMMAGGGGTM